MASQSLKLPTFKYEKNLFLPSFFYFYDGHSKNNIKYTKPESLVEYAITLLLYTL